MDKKTSNSTNIVEQVQNEQPLITTPGKTNLNSTQNKQKLVADFDENSSFKNFKYSYDMTNVSVELQNSFIAEAT